MDLDDNAFRKENSYITLVCDLERSTVEYVAAERTAASLAGYFQGLSPEQLAAIELDQNMNTRRALAIKETLRELLAYHSVAWALKFFRDLFVWAKRSNLEPIKKVADMLRNHLANILILRPQQQNHVYQANSLLLAEQKELQDVDLLPLWRTGSLPAIIQN